MEVLTSARQLSLTLVSLNLKKRIRMDDYREASFDLTNSFLYGTSLGSVVIGLKLIYRRLYCYKWNKSVPDSYAFKNFEVLYGVNDEYILFHRMHHKFGSDIIEFGDSSLRNRFCFFDYSILSDLFNDPNKSPVGPIAPTYHAMPKDRKFYEKERHFYQVLDFD